mmetsp:Transcript_1/g.7  ORF Transcript_1/g.7 Transcript_1/m.7 type:complete len:245 (-) Transcript_1:6-740(-)
MELLSHFQGCFGCSLGNRFGPCFLFAKGLPGSFLHGFWAPGLRCTVLAIFAFLEFRTSWFRRRHFHRPFHRLLFELGQVRLASLPEELGSEARCIPANFGGDAPFPAFECLFLLPVTGLCFCVDLGTCESEAGRVGQLLSFGELVFLSVSGRAFPAGGTDVVFDVFAVSNAVYVCPNVAHFALDHGVSIVGLHATRAVHGPLVVFFFPGRLGMGRSTSHGPPALRFVASRPRATHARVASHVDF